LVAGGDLTSDAFEDSVRAGARRQLALSGPRERTTLSKLLGVLDLAHVRGSPQFWVLPPKPP